MNEGTRKIIAVTPEESSLVRAGTVIMDDAMARKKKSEEDEEELAVVSDKLDIHNDFLFVMVFVSPQSNMGFH